MSRGPPQHSRRSREGFTMGTDRGQEDERPPPRVFVDRGGTHTPGAASRCAASSICSSATTIMGSAWREASEPVSITAKELLNVTNTTDTMTSFVGDLVSALRRTRSNRSTPSPTRGIPTREQNARIIAKPRRWRSGWRRNKGVRLVRGESSEREENTGEEFQGLRLNFL
jgi:hypothetical protein